MSKCSTYLIHNINKGLDFFTKEATDCVIPILT